MQLPLGSDHAENRMNIIANDTLEAASERKRKGKRGREKKIY